MELRRRIDVRQFRTVNVMRYDYLFILQHNNRFIVRFFDGLHSALIEAGEYLAAKIKPAPIGIEVETEIGCLYCCADVISGRVGGGHRQNRRVGLPCRDQLRIDRRTGYSGGGAAAATKTKSDDLTVITPCK